MLRQLTANELADKLDNDEAMTLIDTRTEESFEAWHIHDAVNLPFQPGGDLSDTELKQVERLVNAEPVVSVCGKGLSSASFAVELDQHGFDDVEVVKGGMEDWSKVYEVVPIEIGAGDVEIYQIQRRATGCLGYLVGSRRAGEAIGVDVTRQTDVFKVAAEEAGMNITAVIDTHIHADHLSGGRELADELGTRYHLSGHLDDRDASIEHEFEPLESSDVLTVGESEIKVLHMPGHTTEMINLMIDDEMVLTADTLFIDGVGRTELQFGEEDAARGAELLYESINDVLAALDSEVRILPGHVRVAKDGSFESGSPGSPVSARLGALRESLDVFNLAKGEFVSTLLERDPSKPKNYQTVIAVNTGQESLEWEEEATELELGPNNCSA